jgi:RNA polymerase sigma-70 factor (ECF subfamily)
MHTSIMATETHPENEGRPPPSVVEALVANHRAFLSFLEHRVGDRATAEDILQEAFVRGISKAESIRDDESAVAWFYRLLRNAVIDRARRGAVRVRALEEFASEVATESEPSPDTKGRICACVGELAGTLKPEYSEALRRVEIEGVPVKDYAAEVGITSGNAAVRVFRAREALRKQVTRSCGTCAAHGCLDCTCGSASGCAPPKG